jgi:hypothetical protein
MASEDDGHDDDDDDDNDDDEWAIGSLSLSSFPWHFPPFSALYHRTKVLLILPLNIQIDR